MSFKRIPITIRTALVDRDQAREDLRRREADLQAALAPYAGQTFEVEGVPFKVCGPRGARYWRRLVSVKEAALLREKWRAG